MRIKVKIESVIMITDNDINTILEKAERGTAHWCSKFEHYGEHDNLRFHIQNKIDPYNPYTYFSVRDLVKAIEKYLQNPIDGSFLAIEEGSLVIWTNVITEKIVDDIIQYALFDKIKYIDGKSVN